MHYNTLVRVFFVSIILITLPNLANSLQVDKYLDAKTNQPVLHRNFLRYINGVGEGYGWSNTMLKMNEKTRLFCVPSNLALHENDYVQILENQIKTMHGLEGDWPVEMILLQGLMEKFPCPK